MVIGPPNDQFQLQMGDPYQLPWRRGKESLKPQRLLFTLSRDDDLGKSILDIKLTTF
jgi:hypothetical protein